MDRITRAIAAVGGLGLMLGGASASAQFPSPAPAGRPPSVLDVPYLPQPELLCGGAAVAMVERWWGRRGVYAADFAELIRPGARGISTTDLAAAARARGWETLAFDGTPEKARELLAQGVPVVALIQVAHGRYHFVVVLGWSGGKVTFHDPARGPFRVMRETRFLEQWGEADRWAMALLPAARPPETAGAAPPRGPPDDSLPCRPWLDQALDAVAADRLDEAADRLAEAGRRCPAEPLVRRELAGVRFRQRRHADAARLSAEYLALVPGDAHGWQLLAASRYLTGDREGALRAWNEVGRPTVDLVRIDGVRETRFGMIADAMEVPPGTVLTPSHLALARRRVAEFPALRRAAVEYQPLEGGEVEVRAVVTERPVVGPAWRLLGLGAGRAITQHEVAVAIASPTGGGELWSAAWRWEHADPRVTVRVDMPAHLGVIGVQGTWQRFRFALDSAQAGVFQETRHAGGLTFGRWVLPALRPSVGLRLEEWSGARKYVAATAGTEVRAARDRFALSTTAEYGQALGGGIASYTRGDVRVMWASSPGLVRPAWSARLGLDLASASAPLGLWPVANGDLPSTIPLRAHLRLDGDLLTAATTGRRILHAGLSGDHPIYHAGPFTLAAGIFLDGAAIMNPAQGSARNRRFLDAGGGLRLGILDGRLGVLRIDMATGLTDHRTAITVGLRQGWPPFAVDGTRE